MGQAGTENLRESIKRELFRGFGGETENINTDYDEVAEAIILLLRKSPCPQGQGMHPKTLHE